MEKSKRKRQSRGVESGCTGCVLSIILMAVVGIVILTLLGPAVSNVFTLTTTDDEGQCQQTIDSIKSSTDASGNLTPDELWEGELMPLTPDNAAQLRELNLVGRGSVLNAIETPDKKLLVMTSTGLWQHEPPGGEPAKSWDYAAAGMTATFSPLGKWVVLTHYDYDTLLLDTANGKSAALQTADGEKISMPSHISFSPDETRVAAASYGTVYVWDTTTGDLVANYALNSTIHAIAFAPDNIRLAVSFLQGTTKLDNGTYKYELALHLWNSDTEALQNSYVLPFAANHLVFESDTSIILDTIAVYDDYSSNYPAYQLNLTDSSITEIEATSEAPQSTSDMYASILKLFYPDYRQGVRWLSNGSLIPSGDALNWIRGVYNPNLAAPILHFTPGASNPSMLRVCDAETGKQIKAVLLPESSNPHLSPDGMRLWNIESRSIQIYDGETFKPLEKLPQPDFAHGLLFLPTGEILAVKLDRDDYDAQYLLLWNVRSGEEVARLPLDGTIAYGSPMNITLSPDGTRLVMVDTAGVLHVWGVQGE